MPKEEWGIKRVCPTTGKRFYDLNRTPIVSPYTGEIVQIELPGRKGSPLPSSAASKIKKPLADDIDAEDVLLDDDDIAVEAEDDLLEDDDETVSLDDLSDVPGEEDDV